MTDKPDYYPDWALIKELRTKTDPDTGKIAKGWSRSDISQKQKDYGFDILEGVERGHLNQILYLAGQYIKYLDERCNRPEQYTNSTKPNATTKGAGTLIYISDIDTGGCIAFSDGVNWRKIKDNSTI